MPHRLGLDSRWGRRFFSATLLLSILSDAGAGFAATTGPQGKLRAVLLGDVIDQTGGYNSFTVMDYDPAIVTTLIPCIPENVGGYENAYRNMRVYMPRTYEKLVEGYELIVSSDADRLVFRSEWIGWSE